MPDMPEHLRPYHFHGLEFVMEGDEGIADCPWCGRERKFSVNSKTGLWRCMVCNEGNENGRMVKGGNIYIFLRKLWTMSLENTKPNDYKQLAQDRRLEHPETPKLWGLCRSIATGHWLVPGYNAEGKITGLYQYIKSSARSILYPTPTLGHHLHGVNLYRPKCETVWLCEGPWDAMALWESLRVCTLADGVLKATTDPKRSMLRTNCVLAVPGCEVFLDSWGSLFAGVTVNLMYDNDHPRTHPRTGQAIAPAGLNGMQRVAKLLAALPKPPAALQYLQWGNAGYNPDLPSGYDVRDYLANKQ